MSQKSEILQIADNLLQASKKIEEKELLKLQEASENVGKSWSGSWLGYHSRVYYKGLQPVPLGVRFSKEWGLMNTFSFKETVGDWVEYDFDAVLEKIYQIANNPDLKKYNPLIKETRSCFEKSKSKLLSILSIIKRSQREDKYLTDLIKEIEKIKIFTTSNFIEFLRPSGQQISRDMVAIQSGFHAPPHISVIAEVNAILSSFNSCNELSKLAEKAAFHIENLERQKKLEDKIGRNTETNQGDKNVSRKVITEDDIKKLTLVQFLRRLSIGAWIWLSVIASGIFFTGFKLGLHFEKIKDFFNR